MVTTAGHPFYTATSEWIEASDLAIGTAIRTATWTTGEVEASRPFRHRTPAHIQFYGCYRSYLFCWRGAVAGS